MNKFFKKRLIFSCILIGLGILIIAFILKLEKPSLVRGGVNDNIRGWIWSATDGTYPGGIGWISLNCYNDYAEICSGGINNGKSCLSNDDCPGGACVSDGVAENCCPGGTQCTGPNQPDTTCCPYTPAGVNANYGLSLNTLNNKISGLAWWGGWTGVSAERGQWVCFGETCSGTPPNESGSSWACAGCRSGTICLGEVDGGEGFCNTTDLKGHWKMNEVSWTGTINEVIDYSGMNNHGTAQNGANTTTGKFQRAGSFDGTDDYVSVGNNGLTVVTNFTIEGWTKLNSDASPASWHNIYGRQGKVRLWIKPSSTYQNTDYQFGVWLGGSMRSCGASTLSGVNATKWHHWAFVREGTGLKVYLNGQLIQSCLDSSWTGNADLSGSIGMGSSPPEAPLKGIIDNVAIWSRAKSAEEIWDDAKAEVSGWAKAMWENLPNDGWIKLKGTAQDGKIYGLSLETYSTYYELQDFAWSPAYNPYIAGAGIGWIKFGYGGCLNRVPAQVTGLSVSAPQNCHALNLKWNPVVCAQGYKIYRCRGELCLGPTYLTSIPATSEYCSVNECTYPDSGLSENMTYGYQVRAWNSNGDGPASYPVSYGTTVLCEPEFYSIDDSKCGEIRINWKVVSGATGYNIYRSLERYGCVLGNESTCRKLTTNSITCQQFICGTEQCCYYTDKRIVANVNYYYWATALSEGVPPPESPLGRMNPIVNGIPKPAKSTCLPPTRWQER